MNFNKLIPEFVVSDIIKSIDFYVRVLGFKIEYRRDESGFAFISFQGSQLMLDEIKKDYSWQTGRLEHPFGRGINFQIEVDDINPLFESLKNNNWPIKVMPEENRYRKGNRLLGCKEFLVMDPDGYLLRFSELLGEKSIR